MKGKLNNKGLTVIEILICFSIISVIVVAMFKTISNYKDKQDIESYKNEVITYKNTVTKIIMDDIIENGGIKKDAISDTIPEPIEILNSSSDTTKIHFFVNSSSNSGRYLEIKNNSSSSSIYYHKQMDLSDDKLAEEFVIPDVYHLSFNDIKIDYSDTGFLTVKVGFSQPDLGNSYDALNLNIPVNSDLQKGILYYKN